VKFCEGWNLKIQRGGDCGKLIQEFHESSASVSCRNPKTIDILYMYLTRVKKCCVVFVSTNASCDVSFVSVSS